MTVDQHRAENAAWERAARGAYSLAEIRKIPGPEGLGREEWLGCHLREAFREGYRAAIEGSRERPEFILIPDGTLARVSSIERVEARDSDGIAPPCTIVHYPSISTLGQRTVINHMTLADAQTCRDRIIEMIMSARPCTPPG